MTSTHSLSNHWLLLLAIGLTGCGPEKVLFSGNDFSINPPPPGLMTGHLVITNNGSDTLSVLDVGSGKELWRLPVGFNPVELEGPHHISASPLGDFFYVNLSEAVVGSGGGPHGAHGTGTIPGFALKLSARDGSLVGSAQVDPNPGDTTISSDGKTVYITHYDLTLLAKAVQAGNLRQADTHLAIIDSNTMTVRQRVPLCPLAHGARLSADGHTLYSTCGTDEMAVVQLDTATVTRVPLPGLTETATCTSCPYALGVAPDSSVWVSSLGSGSASPGGSVHVYDASTQAFDAARSVSLCGRALFAAFAKTGTGLRDYLAYVPEQGCGDFVRVYDAGATGQAPREVGAISLPPAACINAHMLLLSTDAKRGYLVCEGDHVNPGTFVLLDLEARSVLSSTPLGVFPDGLALVP